MAVLLKSNRAPQPVLPESPKDSSGAIDDAVSAEVVDIIQYNSQGKHLSPSVSSNSEHRRLSQVFLYLSVLRLALN